MKEARTTARWRSDEPIRLSHNPPFSSYGRRIFGLGLGGFFDGIVLHQVLLRHHMLSSWYPIKTIEELELNTKWDGIFHSTTYLFVLIGLFLLWRAAHRRHLYWSSKLLIGTMLLGFGIFNSVENSKTEQHRADQELRRPGQMSAVRRTPEEE